MATLQELEAAFIKADDAGNVEDARAFADEIRRLRAAPAVKRGAEVPSWMPQPTPEQSAAIEGRLETGEAFLSGARRGAARGFDDEIYAAAQAATGGDYEQAIKEYRAKQEQRKEGSPIASFIGDAAGATVVSPWGFIGSAPTWGARVLQAGGIGGAEGAARAAGETTEGSRAANAGKGAAFGVPIGLVAGGGLEAVRGAYNLGKNTLRSFTERGREHLLGERLNESVGDARRQAVANALRNAGELVPGSAPTAAEAVSDIPEAAAIAAMQRDVARKNTVIAPGEGSIAGAFKAREAAQEGARRAAMAGMAGTDDDMARALAARRAGWEQSFEPIKGDMVPLDDTARELLRRPSLQEALPKAQKIAAEMNRVLPDDANAFQVQDLQTIRRALKDVMEAPPETGLGSAQRAAVKDTYAALGRWLDENAPGLQAARRGYAEASQPINRMDVARELARRLTDPASGAERATRFKGAVENAPQTIRRATGSERGETFADVDPGLDQVVRALMADMGRGARAKDLAQGVEAMRPGSDFPRLPNILEPGVALANRILSMGGRSTQEAMDALAAQVALNPQRMGALMQQFPAPQRQAIVDAILRQAFIAPLAQESASAITQERR